VPVTVSISAEPAPDRPSARGRDDRERIESTSQRVVIARPDRSAPRGMGGFFPRRSIRQPEVFAR
jgi:hypothetical protein